MCLLYSSQGFVKKMEIEDQEMQTWNEHFPLVEVLGEKAPDGTAPLPELRAHMVPQEEM